MDARVDGLTVGSIPDVVVQRMYFDSTHTLVCGFASIDLGADYVPHGRRKIVIGVEALL